MDSAVETVILSIYGLKFPDHHSLMNAIGQLNDDSVQKGGKGKQLTGAKYALYMQASLNGEVLATDPMPLTVKSGSSYIDPSFHFNTQLEFMVSKQAFKYLKSTRAMVKLSCFMIGINSLSPGGNSTTPSATSQVERFPVGFGMFDLRTFTPSEKRQSYKLYSNGNSLFPASSSKSQDIMVDVGICLLSGDVVAVKNEKAQMSLPPSPRPADIRPVQHSPAPMKPTGTRENPTDTFEDDMILAIFHIDDMDDVSHVDAVYNFRLVIDGKSYGISASHDSIEQHIIIPAGCHTDAELFLYNTRDEIVASEKISLPDFLKLGRRLKLGRHSFHLFCTKNEVVADTETNSCDEGDVEQELITETTPTDEIPPSTSIPESYPIPSHEIKESSTSTDTLMDINIRHSKEYKANSLLEDWKSRCLYQFQQSVGDKENILIDTRTQKNIELSNSYSTSSKSKVKEVKVLETRVKALLIKLDNYRNKVKADLEEFNNGETAFEAEFHKISVEHENTTKRLHEEYKTKYQRTQSEYDKLRDEVTKSKDDVSRLQTESKRLEEDAYNESVEQKNTDLEQEMERDNLVEQVKSLRIDRKRLVAQVEQEQETQKALQPKIVQ